MRKYNKIFYNKGIKYSKQKQIETKIFLIASLDIHKLQRNLLVASKTGSVTCGGQSELSYSSENGNCSARRTGRDHAATRRTCCYQQTACSGVGGVGDDRLGM